MVQHGEFHADDDPIGDPTDGLSARERLRSGRVDLPPKDIRRTRRAAAILLLLGILGLPVAGYLFVDGSSGAAFAAGLILLVYFVAMVVLMARTIRRR